MLRPMLPLVLSGVLVTMQGGHEIARDVWRDDGKVETSDVQVGGKTAHLTIDRALRTLSGAEGGQTFKISLPPGSAPLVNLHWAAYAVVAEWFKDATRPTPFKAVVAPSVTLDGTVQVTPTAGGARKVIVTIATLTVEADVDARGQVTHAAVPQQGLEVKSLGAATPGAAAQIAATTAPVHRPPPKGVVEQPFELDHDGAKLAGVTWRPAGVSRPPVVIVIAGSGPVDRDGNAGAALHSDTYRQLAEELARRGIATLRYDKRGVGESTLGKPVADLAFEDGVGDAVAMVALARHDPTFSSVYLFGHSEGSLVALEVAARTPVDGIISAAGAGRPIGEVIKEQFARQLPPGELAEIDGLEAAVRDGQPLHPKSAALAMLFRPSVEKFLRGLLFTDPRELARAYKGKLTVVQGDNDIQITVDKDAKPLAAAHEGARLAVLHNVTHLLKIDRAKGLGQPSYHDPSLPLAPGVVDAVVTTVRQ